MDKRIAESVHFYTIYVQKKKYEQVKFQLKKNPTVVTSQSSLTIPIYIWLQTRACLSCHQMRRRIKSKKKCSFKLKVHRNKIKKQFSLRQKKNGYTFTSFNFGILQDTFSHFHNPQRKKNHNVRGCELNVQQSTKFNFEFCWLIQKKMWIFYIYLFYISTVVASLTGVKGQIHLITYTFEETLRHNSYYVNYFSQVLSLFSISYRSVINHIGRTK